MGLGGFRGNSGLLVVGMSSNSFLLNMLAVGGGVASLGGRGFLVGKVTSTSSGDGELYLSVRSFTELFLSGIFLPVIGLLSSGRGLEGPSLKGSGFCSGLLSKFFILSAILLPLGATVGFVGSCGLLPTAGLSTRGGFLPTEGFVPIPGFAVGVGCEGSS